MVKTNLIHPPPSGLAASAQDLAPIKGPVPIPNVWFWIGCAVGALALGLLAWWWWRRRQEKQAAAPPEVVIPPHEKALARLRELLQWLHQPETFCLLVSDTIRVYLEERFHLHAGERTTEELLEELQPKAILTHSQKQTVGDFLMSCDLVKFARHQPGEDELRGLYNAAVSLVEETQQPAVSAPLETAGSMPQPTP